MSSTASRRFHVGPCLGKGGFGEVYAAQMTSPGGLETAVAIKVLHTDLDYHDDALRRLRDEGRVLAQLDHPSIVRAIDVVGLDGRWALVTELIEGEDLDRCLEEPAGLTERGLFQAVAQVADALDVAAQAPGPNGPLRMVHRDIKPSNVRIGRHGQVKLLDFGIAWFAGEDREAQTASQMMVGSLPYMAPERFTERDQDPASDIFSLGCCLYEGLTGASFYETPRLRVLSDLALHPERFEAMCDAQLENLRDPRFRDIVGMMVHPRPEARATAREVARRCEELADELPGSSLRLWCGLRTWARGGEYTGEWTGKVLTEGAEGRLAVSDAKAAPRIVTAPSETIDPMRDFFASAGEHDVPEKPDRPVAPPAFPSIPVGMAIQNDQISQAEVATVLQGVTPGGSRETFQPEPAQDIPAPEAAPGYSTALYAGAGILVGLLALTGGIIVCAGVVVIATW